MPIRTLFRIIFSVLGSSHKLKSKLFLEILLILIGRGLAVSSAYVISDAVNNAGKSTLMTLAVLPMAYAATRLVDWAMSSLTARMGGRRNVEAMSYCDKALEKMMDMPSERFENGDPTVLASKLGRKSEARLLSGSIFRGIVPPLAEAVLSSLALIGLGMAWASAVLMATAATYFGIWIFTTPKVWRATRGASEAQANAVAKTIALFGKAPLAMIYGTRVALKRMLAETAEDEARHYEDRWAAYNKQEMGMTAILAFALAGFFFYGERLAVFGAITGGAFAAMMSLLISLFAQFRNLAYAFLDVITAAEALSPAYEVLSSSRVVKNDESSKKEKGRLDIVGLKVEISGAKILNGASFSLEYGDKAFVVGMSGAGKTTLLKSLMGMAPISEGETRYCGKPASEESSIYAWVPQEAEEPYGAVRDALCLGREGATDDEMVDALKRAKLWDKIEGIGGLDAKLGFDGARLSGGEKQRLSIARALLSGRPVMLLDEPTSALDSVTEKAVMRELMSFEGTILACAHRVRAIPKHALAIYVENGAVAEFGEVANLIKNRGKFYELWRSGESE